MHQMNAVSDRREQRWVGRHWPALLIGGLALAALTTAVVLTGGSLVPAESRTGQAAPPPAAGTAPGSPDRAAKVEAAERRKLELNWLLFETLSRGDAASTGRLLDLGADVNTMFTAEYLLNTDLPADQQLGTPLFFAAQRSYVSRRDLDRVRLLLDRGADVRLRTSDGGTALH
jgi:hypothetical protein